MRSQKINNRSPRPFKTKADRWSGGQNFIPVSGPRPAAKPPEKKPAEKKADGK
ncbi:hypothetical protein [Prosthecobacter sp.]|uniref:hypothetical protein n=1 Tax=Prosthecobacter sp. TaxID=1965333 RepID=UPI00378403F1